jgi:hypothetical protein
MRATIACGLPLSQPSTRSGLSARIGFQVEALVAAHLGQRPGLPADTRRTPTLPTRRSPGPGGEHQFRDVRRQADDAPRRSGEPDHRAAGIGDDDLGLHRLHGQGDDHSRQQA